MKRKFLCIYILALLSGCNGSSSSSAQEQMQITTDTTKKENAPQDSFINQKDKQGRKQGLWIEDKKYGLQEVYYLNGLKNGVFKSYFPKNDKLEAFGWYEQDKPSGTWYYFDETTRLYLSATVLEGNKEIKVKNDEGNYILLPFKSYIKVYHKNGLLAEEGLGLYDESVQIDFYMFGAWKYYDETGKLIMEENYNEGKSFDGTH